MEKIIKQVARYKQVRDGFRDVETYLSLDGVEYLTEREALDADGKFLTNKYSKKINGVAILNYYDEVYHPYSFSKAETEEELEFLIRWLDLRDRADFAFNGMSMSADAIIARLNLGVYYGSHYVDNGDSRSDVYVYELTFYKAEMMKALLKLG